MHLSIKRSAHGTCVLARLRIKLGLSALPARADAPTVWPSGRSDKWVRVRVRGRVSTSVGRHVSHRQGHRHSNLVFLRHPRHAMLTPFASSAAHHVMVSW